MPVSFRKATTIKTAERSGLKKGKWNFKNSFEPR